MKLPIEIISEDPLKFRWEQELNLPSGIELVPQEGHLPTNVEEAVAALIRLCKSQASEIDRLKRRIDGPDGLVEVVVAQGKRLEKYEQQYEVGDKPLSIDSKVFFQEESRNMTITNPNKKKGK